MFTTALADPGLSNFQRTVLSDYQITDAEFQESRESYIECMADRGWKATMGDNGADQIAPLPGAVDGMTDQQQVDKTYSDDGWCTKEYTNYVVMIYSEMKANPQGLDYAGMVRQCFKDHGVPDGANLSQDAFAAMLEDPSYHASTPEGTLCYYDPDGRNGLSVKTAELWDSQR